MRRALAIASTVATVVATTMIVVSGPASADPSANDWYQLRMCESTNRYDINTGKQVWRAYSTGPDAEMLIDPNKTMTWTDGTSTSGISSLGMDFVAGSIRVPSPATRAECPGSDPVPRSRVGTVGVRRSGRADQ